MSIQDTMQQLADRLSNTNNIVGFQIYGTNKTEFVAGFQNDQLGTIYQPVQQSTNCRIKYLVIGRDQTVGYGSYNPYELTNIEDVVASILQIMVPLEKTIPLAPTMDANKSTKLADPAMVELLQDPSGNVTTAKQFQEQLLEHGCNSVEAQFGITYQQSYFVSSKTKLCTSSRTECSYSAEFDSEVGTYANSITSLTPQDIAADFAAVANYSKVLKAKPANIKSGITTVVIDPMSGFELLDRFVLQNISGNGVAAGTTKYRADDFKEHLQIAHKDLHLPVDQSIPMSVDSFNFTSDGIGGQQFAILDHGKLVEPICNLESAQELDSTPRALASIATAQVASAKYADFCKNHERFVVVLGLLGIHTQNHVVGKYSLPAPSALLVEKGQIIGPVKVAISGNMFEDLQQKSTSFVDLPGYQKPALSLQTQIKPL